MNMMFIIHYKNIGKNNDSLQLLISSYIAENKSKHLYNKINELLYKIIKMVSSIKNNIRIL